MLKLLIRVIEGIRGMIPCCARQITGLVPLYLPAICTSLSTGPIDPLYEQKTTKSTIEMHITLITRQKKKRITTLLIIYLISVALKQWRTELGEESLENLLSLWQELMCIHWSGDSYNHKQFWLLLYVYEENL